MKCRLFDRRLAVALMCLTSLGFAQDDNPAKTKDDQLTTRRFALMQKRVASAQVSSGEDGFPKKFSEKPIFRYTDPARQYVAAAVWKLGDTGRPRAIITTELRRRDFDGPRIVYEYLSLTPARFVVTGGDFGWMPAGTALEFKPVSDAPRPHDTAARRLGQMRAIVQRFSGKEVVRGETCALRLLPQPVDRYAPSTADRADGAIFIATFGTNPEVALFLESDGKQWSYAAGRLGGAQIIELSIDGKTAWEGPVVRYAPDSSYTASSARANIPGLAPDGSEIVQQ